MYPNFPEQVMELSDAELYLNAIIHYLTDGKILPSYETEERETENLWQKQKVISYGTTYLLLSFCSSPKEKVTFSFLFG